MPIYCYKNEQGTCVDHVFKSFKDKDLAEKIDKANRRYIMLNGERYYRDFKSEKRSLKTYPGSWPQYSTALGVNPSQRKEAIEHANKIGVPTYFNHKGQAVFRDRNHRKRYMNKTGYKDLDGGYSD